eukprot:TRINITY_DN8268_c1_g1_i8.p1 TRINITY_DN8268_c1_g1~~TRINITY_DN8268_c1_g1_i8.p1  ORF type:complete len:924 (+),score=192.42 TRINITY_DN8268_c1_g1_i8:113-2884(+)
MTATWQAALEERKRLRLAAAAAARTAGPSGGPAAASSAVASRAREAAPPSQPPQPEPQQEHPGPSKGLPPADQPGPSPPASSVSSPPPSIAEPAPSPPAAAAAAAAAPAAAAAVAAASVGLPAPAAAVAPAAPPPRSGSGGSTGEQQLVWQRALAERRRLRDQQQQQQQQQAPQKAAPPPVATIDVGEVLLARAALASPQRSPKRPTPPQQPQLSPQAHAAHSKVTLATLAPPEPPREPVSVASAAAAAVRKAAQQPQQSPQPQKQPQPQSQPQSQPPQPSAAAEARSQRTGAHSDFASDEQPPDAAITGLLPPHPAVGRRASRQTRFRRHTHRPDGHGHEADEDAASSGTDSSSGNSNSPHRCSYSDAKRREEAMVGLSQDPYTGLSERAGPSAAARSPKGAQAQGAPSPGPAASLAAAAGLSPPHTPEAAPPGSLDQDPWHRALAQRRRLRQQASHSEPMSVLDPACAILGAATRRCPDCGAAVAGVCHCRPRPQQGEAPPLRALPVPPPVGVPLDSIPGALPAGARSGAASVTELLAAAQAKGHGPAAVGSSQPSPRDTGRDWLAQLQEALGGVQHRDQSGERRVATGAATKPKKVRFLPLHEEVVLDQLEEEEEDGDTAGYDEDVDITDEAVGNGEVRHPSGSRKTRLPPRCILNPRCIRFCQARIDRSFWKSGRRLDEVAADLRCGRLRPEDLPPIHVFEWPAGAAQLSERETPAEMRGSAIFSADNRRLWVFKHAGVSKIPVRRVQLSSVNPVKLSTSCAGIAVRWADHDKDSEEEEADRIRAAEVVRRTGHGSQFAGFRDARGPHAPPQCPPTLQLVKRAADGARAPAAAAAPTTAAAASADAPPRGLSPVPVPGPTPSTPPPLESPLDGTPVPLRDEDLCQDSPRSPAAAAAAGSPPRSPHALAAAAVALATRAL